MGKSLMSAKLLANKLQIGTHFPGTELNKLTTGTRTMVLTPYLVQAGGPARQRGRDNPNRQYFIFNYNKYKSSQIQLCIVVSHNTINVGNGGRTGNSDVHYDKISPPRLNTGPAAISRRNPRGF